MTNYAQLSGQQKTPQTEKARVDQVKNSAKGYGFKVDKWVTLDRFLIMGVTGNTFYANQSDIVRNDTESMIACIKEDGRRYVNRIVDIASSGRAVKQDTLTFALALAQKHGTIPVRQYAYSKVSIVCSTFYHLTNMLNDRKGLGLGWSRGLRSAIDEWYGVKGLEYLIYQALKYPSRNNWTQRNVVRMAHIHSSDPARQMVYDWLCARTIEDRPNRMNKAELGERLYRMYGYSQAYARDLLFAVPTVSQAITAIRGERLTREMIPTELLTDAKVWEGLVRDMPYMATVRNLNKLSAVGVIDPVSGNDVIEKRLTNKDFVQLSKIHPINLLIASRVYGNGIGNKGDLRWTPSPRIASALDTAFLSAMASWPKTNKRLLVAVDISGSMRQKLISDTIPFYPAEIAGAIAVTLAHTEPNTFIMGFTLDFEPMSINSKTSVADAIMIAQNLETRMGATDCAMPMMYALGYDANQRIERGRIVVGDYIKSNRKPLNVDAFVIITDNETWAGKIHPHEALEMYRKQVNPKAKLISIAVQPSRFHTSIVDPLDPNSLDIVGFDSNVPQLVQDFVTGGG